MFKTYKSSAGSGKTTNLVAEYLSLCLLNPTQYKHILAITFTNNATAEMKSRIVDTLYQFAFVPLQNLSGSEEAILKMVQNNCPSLNPIDIPSKSQMLLSNILYDYPNFSISTIDSFFQRIIRAFAFDLNINLNFSLEITLDDYFAQTVDLLLNRISKSSSSSNDLSKRVLQLINTQLIETGRWQIEKELTKILYKIYDEDTFLPMRELQQVTDLDSAVQTINTTRNDLAEKLRKLADEGNELIVQTGLEASDFFQGKRCIYGWFDKFKQNIAGVTADNYILTCINERGYFSKAKDRISDSLHKQIVDKYQYIKNLQKKYLKFSIFGKNLQAISFLFDLKNIMDEIKSRDNLFYLSETNFRIYDEVRGEEAPYIFEKLGNKYSYFFIDEFQDTCNLQWQNLLPLIKNALSSGGNAILFGDVKQAIYRFRNGDSTLFAELTTQEGYKKNIAPLDSDARNFDKVSLNTNYRSDGNIVNFNNAFFDYLANESQHYPDKAQIYYDDVKQRIADGKKGGLVSIHFRDASAENYLLDQVYKSVIDAQNRGFELKDIAILSKSRSVASQIGIYLAAQGIEVITSDSLLLSSSVEVNLIVSVLRFLLDANDKLSQTVIANYVINHFATNMSLPDVLDKVHNSQDFLNFLADQNIDLQPLQLIQLPLFTLVNHILKIFALDSPDAFVACFVENVLSYLQKHNAELVSFLDWWNGKEGSLSISTPAGVNAVTIMTIHKSKGLQFPVVILPFFQYGMKKTKEQFWFKDENNDSGLPFVLLNNSKNLSDIGLGDYYDTETDKTAIDNLNILYVAHTRPKNILYIITGAKKEDIKGPHGNYNLFLEEFINQKKIDCIQDENDSLQFWYGDKNCRKGISLKLNSDDNDGVSCQESIEKLPFTDFQQSQLAYRFPQFNTKERLRGLVVHDFLSQLIHFPQTEQELQNMQIQVEESFVHDVRTALQTIMKHERFSELFSDNVKVLNEIAILTSSGEVRRPDRVVVTDGGVFVIDYKTGTPSPNYDTQLSDYIELLRQMGYAHVDGMLFYI